MFQFVVYICLKFRPIASIGARIPQFGIKRNTKHCNSVGLHKHTHIPDHQRYEQLNLKRFFFSFESKKWNKVESLYRLFTAFINRSTHVQLMRLKRAQREMHINIDDDDSLSSALAHSTTVC